MKYRVITGTLKARTAVHVGSGEGNDLADALLRRDTEGTILIPGTAIAGALRGVEGIPDEWAQKARQLSARDQEQLAMDLARTAIARQFDQSAAAERLATLYRMP